jgi:glycosyl transferase family 2
MAFRRDVLAAVGGFDPQFRAAGDDVDVCWKLEQAGQTIGFNPAALVWHYRRASVRAYLRQQVGYGKAEALLERKWPEKYNAAGHATWSGRLYGTGAGGSLWRRWRVYYGVWGSGLFQRLYQPAPGTIGSLPLMPEWILVVLALAGLSLLGLAWTPLLVVALPLFALAAAVVPIDAVLVSARANFATHPRRERWKRRALTAMLNVLQPLARLRGRIDHGLTPWRRRGRARAALPVTRELTVWNEHWVSPETRLLIAEEGLRAEGVALEVGGEFDRWDLEVRGGFFGCARLRLAVEEHGGGKQLARFRIWPRIASGGPMLILPFAATAVVAGVVDDHIATIALGAIAGLLLLRLVQGLCEATGALRQAVARQEALAQHELVHDLDQRARDATLAVPNAS